VFYSISFLQNAFSGYVYNYTVEIIVYYYIHACHYICTPKILLVQKYYELKI